MMKPLSLIAAGLLAVGCSASEGTAPTGDNSPAPQFGAGPVVHRVSVGGPDACTGVGSKPGCDANFSILAIQFADGTVKGQYIDRFAPASGFHGFHAVVNCLNIVGNDAWISGVITQGEFEGLPVITRVRDVGTSANDPPDQISFSFIGDPTSCLAAPELPLFDAPEGQTVVVN